MASKSITNTDIIKVAVFQLDEYAEALDLVQVVRAGMPNLTEYYRSTIQNMCDSLQELTQVIRENTEVVSA